MTVQMTKQSIKTKQIHKDKKYQEMEGLRSEP